MRDLLVLIVLPFLIYAAFRKPIVGLGLWLWSSVFNINAILYGIASAVTYSKFFAILTILSYLVKKNSFPRSSSNQFRF